MSSDEPRGLLHVASVFVGAELGAFLHKVRHGISVGPGTPVPRGPPSRVQQRRPRSAQPKGGLVSVSKIGRAHV